MDSINLFILSYIGGGGWFEDPGFMAKDVYDALAANPNAKEINVTLNSRGGDVAEGEAIYNALAFSGKTVNITVVGSCMSIATIIAMAASPGKLRANENAQFMIHPAWTFAEGNADQLQKIADELKTIDSRLFSYYTKKRAGKLTISEQDLRHYFDEETFFSAERAAEIGLIDEVVMEEVMLNYREHYYHNRKAYAFYTPKTKTMNISNEDKSWFETAFAQLKSLISGSAPAETAVEEEKEEEKADPTAELQAQLAALQAENDTLKASIATVQAEKAAAEASALATQNKVNDLASQFDAFKARIQGDDDGVNGKEHKPSIHDTKTKEGAILAYYETLKSVSGRN